MREDAKHLFYSKGSRREGFKEPLKTERHQTKQALHQGAEDLDDHDSPNKMYRSAYSHKIANYNYVFLDRFLISRLGKKWDDVKKELNEVLDHRSDSAKYTMRRLKGFNGVWENTYKTENGVWADTKFGPTQVYPDIGWGVTFYVDPDNGTLQMTQKRTWRRNVKSRTEYMDEFRFIDPTYPLVQQHKIKGIWYEIKLRRPTPDEEVNKSFGRWVLPVDAPINAKPVWKPCPKLENNRILKQITDTHRGVWNYFPWDATKKCKMFFGGLYFPVFKRQLSKSEIKKK